jgi:hypothetical protein
MYIKFVVNNLTSVYCHVFSSWHQKSISCPVVGVFMCYLGTRFRTPGVSDRLSVVSKIKETVLHRDLIFLQVPQKKIPKKSVHVF